MSAYPSGVNHTLKIYIDFSEVWGSRDVVMRRGEIEWVNGVRKAGVGYYDVDVLV